MVARLAIAAGGVERKQQTWQWSTFHVQTRAPIHKQITCDEGLARGLQRISEIEIIIFIGSDWKCFIAKLCWAQCYRSVIWLFRSISQKSDYYYRNDTTIVHNISIYGMDKSVYGWESCFCFLFCTKNTDEQPKVSVLSAYSYIYPPQMSAVWFTEDLFI